MTNTLTEGDTVAIMQVVVGIIRVSMVLLVVLVPRRILIVIIIIIMQLLQSAACVEIWVSRRSSSNAGVAITDINTHIVATGIQRKYQPIQEYATGVQLQLITINRHAMMMISTTMMMMMELLQLTMQSTMLQLNPILRHIARVILALTQTNRNPSGWPSVDTNSFPKSDQHQYSPRKKKAKPKIKIKKLHKF